MTQSRPELPRAWRRPCYRAVQHVTAPREGQNGLTKAAGAASTAGAGTGLPIAVPGGETGSHCPGTGAAGLTLLPSPAGPRNQTLPPRAGRTASPPVSCWSSRATLDQADPGQGHAVPLNLLRFSSYPTLVSYCSCPATATPLACRSRLSRSRRSRRSTLSRSRSRSRSRRSRLSRPFRAVVSLKPSRSL